MSSGEMAYLGLCLLAFVTFIGGVGFISVWSRKSADRTSADATSTGSQAMPAAHRRAA